MKNLKNEIMKAAYDHTTETMARFDAYIEAGTPASGSENYQWYYHSLATKYKGTPEQIRAKVLRAVNKERDNKINKELGKIAAVEAFAAENGGPKLPRPVIVRIIWTKNRTWGYTAKADDNYGHNSDVASGGGYDKASTATAGVLNAHPLIMLRLYAAADKAIAEGKAKRQEIGYGCGYNVLPYLEGGVGVSCHVEILKRLGFAVEWGNDVLVISEK